MKTGNCNAVGLLYVLIGLFFTGSSDAAPRKMEKLNRGGVAVSTGSGNYVGWRMLGNEPSTVGYNVYRDAVKINTSPITDSTNLLDTEGNSDSTYSVVAVIDGVEQEFSAPVDVWSSYYKDIPIQRPDGGTTPDAVDYTYSPNDISVGDLDGDGELEIVLKWDPSNSKDNAHSGYSGNVFLDAYKLDGSFLWRIDLGINIRAGAHYTQFMVYDLDGDGRAELVCKTADGTVDGEGAVLGNASADYRNSAGRILSGPEYLSAFDGRTGAFIDTVDYVPVRGTVSSWGDDYGNRVDRFLACVAYLDGENPSVVMCRGYYTRTVLAAWDLVDGQLVQRWVFDSNDSGNSAYAGQGNHNLSVADVDGDGKDEIIYGSCTIDDDGTGLYSTGLGHGDALHVSDMDPSRPGLELWMPHETSASGATYRDAGTGQILVNHDNSGDVGRGVAAHIDARYPGYQLWSYAVGGVYNTDGTKISDNYSGTMMSFLVWWTGNLQREFMASAGSGGSPIIERWTGDGAIRHNSIYNVPSSYDTKCINGTKANPCLSGDLLGDWREELIFYSADREKLRIFTTTAITAHRIHTLLHDPQYRMAIAWQNVGYNQPPHPGFYIGEGMSDPPTPDIKPVETTSAPAFEYLESGGVLSMEAENGRLGFRWGVGADAAASGGKYLEVGSIHNYTGTSPAGTTDDYLATYDFNVSSAGDYRFWFRILSDSADDDSFFWRIDDGGWTLENNRSGISSWFDSDSAELGSLAAGDHVLQISYRENGTRLDKFVIQQEGQPAPAGEGPAESSRLELPAQSEAPDAPFWLEAAAEEDVVSLSWFGRNGSDLSGYTVYRSTVSGSGYAAIASEVSSTAYTDDSAVDGTTYYYTVTATDTLLNESGRSEEVSAVLPDFTRGPVAHWDFADAGAVDGGWIPGNGARDDLDGDGAMDSDDFRIGSTDLSGHGNHLTAWSSTWMKWSSDSAQGDFSMVNGGSYPAAGTDSAYNPFITGLDVEEITPAEWTVEVVFKATGTSGIQTMVGRDGRYISTASADAAALYLQMAGSALRIVYVDVGGARHDLQVAAGLAAYTWYSAAAVSDGSTLRLYLDGSQIGSLDLTSSGTDTALALGYGSWSVARGMWAGGHTDRFFGYIDEVAISGVALSPGSFVTTGNWPEGYEFYFDEHGIAGAPFDGDANSNGVPNGMEYFLGWNPSVPGTDGRVLTFSEDFLSVQYPYNSTAYGVTGSVEWITDLTSSNWINSGVAYATNSLPDAIEATLGATTTNQLFIRLKVENQ